MEYRKIGDNYYIRMDRGDEIIGNLLSICEKESIPSAVFSGIGGCQSAELQVFIPERLRVGERSSGMTGSFFTESFSHETICHFACHQVEMLIDGRCW